MSEIRILIVEDDPFISLDIEHSLNNIDYLVSGIAYDTEEALNQLAHNLPDAVLLDISLGDHQMDGIDIASIINQKYQIPFLYLTSHADRSTLERAKKTFPSGYIVKPFTELSLLAALEIAIYNHAKLQIAIEPSLSFAQVNKSIQAPLSEREFEVLQQIYEGKTNQQMAEVLFVSVNTIKTHIASIYTKLGVASRTAAIAKIRN
jgi:DNA-binding NarL/FixJ family response regulator